MPSLSGRTVIITGASRGIGAATARKLTQSGANVVLAARNQEQINALAAELNEQRLCAVAAVCDVSKFEDFQHVVDVTTRQWGRIDVLVNNAGTIDPIARLADSDPGAWRTVIDINLMGVYHGIRAVLPVMETQGNGVIINISSGAATNALEGWSHYCASKAAVLSLTTCVHKEYYDSGIRCIGLSPGTVATDMQVSIKQSGINPVSKMDFSQHIPPQWPAQAIAYLCTEDAARFSGTDFSIKTQEGRKLAGLE